MNARIDLAQLKQRIASIPALRPEARASEGRLLSTGLPPVDAYLGATPLGAVHEIAGHGGDEEQGAAGAAFLALSLKASAPAGWIAWVTQENDLYAPGLAAFGLDLRRLILVSARRDAEVCWALEEALRSRSLAAVVAEVGILSLTATRRLQLAAEQAGIPCFLLRRWRTQQLAQQQRAQPIAAVTRWRISPQPHPRATDQATMPELGPAHWRLDLWRCRNAAAASWIMEFDHADQQRVTAFPVPVAAALADRSTSPAPAAEAERATAALVRFG